MDCQAVARGRSQETTDLDEPGQSSSVIPQRRQAPLISCSRLQASEESVPCNCNRHTRKPKALLSRGHPDQCNGTKPTIAWVQFRCKSRTAKRSPACCSSRSLNAPQHCSTVAAGPVHHALRAHSDCHALASPCLSFRRRGLLTQTRTADKCFTTIQTQDNLCGLLQSASRQLPPHPRHHRRHPLRRRRP